MAELNSKFKKCSDSCDDLQTRTDEVEATMQKVEQRITTETGDVERQFTHVCAKLEHKLTQDIGELDARIERQRVQVFQKCTDTEQSFEVKHAVLEKQMEDQHGYFSKLCANIDLKVVQQTDELRAGAQYQKEHLTAIFAEMDTKLTETGAAQDARMDELDQRIQDDRQHFTTVCTSLDHTSQEHHRHFTNVCEALDEKFTETCAACDARVENQQHHFTDICANLDHKFMEKNAAQDARMENQRLQLIDLCDNLDQKLEEKSNAQERRMSEVSDIIEENRQELTSVCDGLSTAMTGRTDAQDERMDKLSDAVQENHRHFTEVSKTLDKKFTEEKAALDELVKDHFGHFTDLCSQIEQQMVDKSAAQDEVTASNFAHFENICTDLDSALASAMAEHTGRMDEQSVLIEREHEKLLNVCAELDEKFMLKADAQAELTDANFKHLLDVTGDISAKLEQSASAQVSQTQELAGTIQSHHGHFTGVCSSLDDKCTGHIFALRDAITKFAEKNAAQDAALRAASAETAELRVHVNDATASLDQKLSAETANQTENLGQMRLHLTGLCAELEQKLEAGVATQDLRMDTLSNGLHQHQDTLHKSIAAIDSKYELINRDQNERMDEQHTQVTSTIADLKTATTAKDAEHDAAVTDLKLLVQEQHIGVTNRFNSVQEAMDVERARQDGRFDKHVADFSDAVRDVDQRQSAAIAGGEAVVAELAQTVDRYHHSIKGDLDRLASSVAIEQDGHSKALDQLKNHTEQMRKVMKEELLAKNELQDSRAEELSSMINRHFAEHSANCRQLDDKFTQDNSARDQRILDQRTHLSSVLAELEKKVVDKATSQDARMDDLSSIVTEHQQHFSAVCEEMKQNLTEQNSAQDSKAAAQHNHFTEVCEEMKQTWKEKIRLESDRVSDLAVAIRDSHEQLSSSCAGIEQRFAEKNAAQDEVLQQQGEQTAEISASVDQRLSDVQTDAKAQTDVLMNTLEEKLQHFSNVCSNIDSKFSQKMAAQDDRMNTQEEHFKQSHDNLTQSVSAERCPRCSAGGHSCNSATTPRAFQ